MNKLIKESWFLKCTKDCIEIAETVKVSLVGGYHKIGERILQEHENFERSKIYGEKILQDLAISTGIGIRTLAYAVQFAKKYPQLKAIPDIKNVSWNKVITEYLPESKKETKKA